MTSDISVIIAVDAGGRALLRTADSITRQRAAPLDVMLVKAAAHAAPPLLASVLPRLGARTVEAAGHPGVALNAAAASGRGRHLAIVPAGFSLQPSFLERCTAMLSGDATLSALAPAVLLHTADAIGKARWVPGGLDAAAVLADPASVPPVFVVRRSAWETLGRFDEALAGLVEYEFWLRLVLAGHRVDRVIDHGEPLVARQMSETASPADDGEYLTLLREVLAAHASAIAADMREVLVAREVRFGRSRELHRGLLARRDADLAELDRLRAEAAHHRAYLEHQGRSAVDWGDLRRVDPVSRDWGYDRGVPIDRRYIDEFLSSHSSDIHGSVLEIQEDDFTRVFGGPRVSEHEVLDIDGGNPRATILADLRCAPQIPSARFDCIILTQTLHVIDDMPAALRECDRILKPGGVLLVTVPAASRVCLEYGEEGDLWRMTPAGARTLVHAAFGPSHTSRDVFGNVLTKTAFLHGFAAAELSDAEFDARDPYFPALTGLRVRKADVPERAGPRGIVLLYHRLDDTHDIHDLSVPASLFEAHLRLLRERCTLMPLDELLRTPPELLPDRPVAITFDDGYLDNLLVASPLLRSCDAPATFFLTSRWLDEPGEYWWDALERILLHSASVPDVLDVDLASGPRRFTTADRESRLSAHRHLHDAMVHASLEARDRIVDRLRAWSAAAAMDGTTQRIRPMLADEARDLAAVPGMTIGAHTTNHLSLPDQAIEVQDREIADCRAALARVTGRPIDLFAYPYGSLNRQVAALVRRSCRWGLSCDERTLEESFDAARVPRVDVRRWDVAAFAATIDRLFAVREQQDPDAFARLP